MNPAADTDHPVVLVDVHDREIGTCPKLAAHRDGKLHRAVSVFVFDQQQRLLIQRRADGKYHSGGLWSNTCCTHPRPGSSPMEAAAVRLKEEMGFACKVHPAGNFVYRAEFENGLIEHEYDHLFLGWFAGEPNPDPSEVSDWRRTSLEELMQDRQEKPQEYSVWFWPGLDNVLNSSLWQSTQGNS